MISKMHFYINPFFRTQLLDVKDIEFLKNKINDKSFIESLIVKEGKSLLDKKMRKSKSKFFKSKKIEQKITSCLFEKLMTLDDSISKKKCEKIQVLQLAIYKKGDFFKWHQDTYSRNSRTTNRIMTIVIAVNNFKEFKGGELELIDYNDNVYKIKNLKQGEAVIFPSDYYHRVTPILKGSRISLTAWIMGEELEGMHSI